MLLFVSFGKKGGGPLWQYEGILNFGSHSNLNAASCRNLEECIFCTWVTWGNVAEGTVKTFGSVLQCLLCLNLRDFKTPRDDPDNY